MGKNGDGVEHKEKKESKNASFFCFDLLMQFVVNIFMRYLKKNHMDNYDRSCKWTSLENIEEKNNISHLWI